MANPQAVVSPARLSVTPGGEAATELRVHNEGNAEERFRFQVRGDEATWVSVSPFALTVGPGEDATAQVFVRPPRTSAVRAGEHRVELSIRLASDRTAEGTAIVEVTVSAFDEVVTRLAPDSSRAPGQFVLRVDNKGNAPLRATVEAAEGTPPGSLRAVPASLSVEAGRSADVQVSVDAPRRLAGRGSGAGRPFSVSVTPEGSAPIVSSGSVEPQAMLTRRRTVEVAAALVVLVVVVVVAATVLFSSSSKSPSKANANTAASLSQNCPGAGHLAHDANGQTRANVLEPDNYSFLFEQTGGCQPIRWNPCAPIHYVVNQSNATTAELGDVTQAVAQVSQATGIQFIDDGTTTTDFRDWQPYQPTVYPGRWAPVLIQFQHLGVQNNIIQTAGDGLPIQYNGVYVSGIMGLNLDAHLLNNVQVPDGFGAGVTWGRVLLHELGHVVGLGHVTGVTEIMHEPVTEETSPTSAYGFGDLSGLRLLGRTQGCLTTPAPSSSANLKRAAAP